MLVYLHILQHQAPLRKKYHLAIANWDTQKMVTCVLCNAENISLKFGINRKLKFSHCGYQAPDSP